MTRRVRESELDNMRMDRNGCASACEELRRERDELLAHCERLRGSADKVNHWHDTSNGGMIVSAETVRGLWVALSKTPAQSLREIRAEAVEEARDSLVGSLSLFEHPDESDYARGFERGFNQCSDQFTEFAQQIREGKE